MRPDENESLVRRVADAIYQSQVTSARDQVARFDLDLGRFERVAEAADRDSDRSAAILLFSLAEDLMLEGLRRHLNSVIPGGWKGVTEGNGLLATASNRLTLLHLLFWIRESTASDLRLLKSIRNRFAHHVDVESFDDPRISGWISTLTAHEESAGRVFDDTAEWRRFTNGELYLIRATSSVMNLMHDLAVGPISRFERVSPGDVAGQWESAPENLKNLRRVTAEALLRYLPPR